VYAEEAVSNTTAVIAVTVIDNIQSVTSDLIASRTFLALIFPKISNLFIPS
jgi:hypothetical protein